MRSTDDSAPPRRTALFGRAAGPVLFLAILLLPAGSMGEPGLRVAAVIAWMAVWWVTEAVPLAATSMLPLVLLPLLGVRGVRELAPSYSDHVIFLFLGGFVLALAVERSGLHRRIALAALGAIGTSPRRLVWGFAIASAGLSMWLSNTATALMMLPIAGGVAERLVSRTAATRLFLAVAYGASVGGLGTLIGTPPNLVLAGMAPGLVPDLPPPSFGGWMAFAVPVLLVLLPAVCLLLGRGLPDARADASGLLAERRALGRPSHAERRAAVLFAATALAWISREGLDVGSLSIPGWQDLLPDPARVSDAVPAVLAAILATMIPCGGGQRRPLVTWDEVGRGVPWGVLILFGGGFALADAVATSGLDTWLAHQLGALEGLPLPVIVLAVALFTTSATELTSNTATATLLMPVMAALAAALEAPPYLLMVPATLAASCAFMLPVATPPNAIVIGTGRVTSLDLFREGLWMNLISAAAITVLTLTLGRLVLPT